MNTKNIIFNSNQSLLDLSNFNEAEYNSYPFLKQDDEYQSFIKHYENSCISDRCFPPPQLLTGQKSHL